MEKKTLMYVAPPILRPEIIVRPEKRDQLLPYREFTGEPTTIAQANNVKRGILRGSSMSLEW